MANGSIRTEATGATDVIVVRGLEKTYRDGTQAVKGIDFEVRPGEIFGLLGPNGAGKTTTMRILGTLHGHSAGTAHVLGLDVEKDAAELRHRIGFAMQEVGMDDLATAEEMLMFHAGLYGIDKEEARLRAKRLLDTFDLAKHAKRRVMRFSGGMQRRLDLAVSLIHEPEMLFLDEPSTGLDPTSRADLWEVLRRLRRDHGLTILMSTHYMEEADELCDRIAIINDGVVAAIDTPERLKRSVGADTIHVTLGAPVDAATQERLRARFGPGHIRFHDGRLTLKVKDGGRALMPALRILQDCGLRIAATRVQTPTLDDVFLKYTGQRLASDDDGGAAA